MFLIIVSPGGWEGGEAVTRVPCFPEGLLLKAPSSGTARCSGGEGWRPVHHHPSWTRGSALLGEPAGPVWGCWLAGGWEEGFGAPGLGLSGGGERPEERRAWSLGVSGVFLQGRTAVVVKSPGW